MFRKLCPAILISAALAAPGTAFAAQERAVADPQTQCERLAGQAAELRSQRNAAGARRVGGFLANIAGRAMAYAPSPDLGDNVLARAAGQTLESEAHERVGSQLDGAEQRGRTADAGSASEPLRAVEAEAARLNCPGS